jgi:sortase (surface protein transpeptidase)
VARQPLALALLAGGLLIAGGATAGLLLLPSGRPADRPQPVARAAALPSGAMPFPSGVVVAPPSPLTGEEVAAPASLSIPAIGVRTGLLRLGLTARGTLQVPSSTSVAGWFTGSPRPGAVGSSIIAGHIDSYRGPGVFFRLRLLRPGDRVYVRRSDGTLAAFRVYAEHMYLKDRFPTGLVYGPAPDAELRLITCGGVFDRATGSYLSNVVVYAAQVR